MKDDIEEVKEQTNDIRNKLSNIKKEAEENQLRVDTLEMKQSAQERKNKLFDDKLNSLTSELDILGRKEDNTEFITSKLQNIQKQVNNLESNIPNNKYDDQ